jgi:tetratricopeptide (TPR) repeat protein
MRPLIFTFFIFIFNLSFGQSEFEKQYSMDVCSCLEGKHMARYTIDNFVVCFQETLQNDSALLMQEYKKIYGDTLYLDKRHFGHDLFEKIKVSMISECKPYFMLFDSLRYKSIKKLNHDSLKMQLKSLDTVALINMNEKFYNQKALLLFQLSMYDSSLINSEKVLKLDSNNAEALFIKGWINEIKGNYDQAISLYNKVAKLTKQDSFLIFSAIAKRKKISM